MNDDLRETEDNYSFQNSTVAEPVTEPVVANSPPEIPDYLQDTYWWAYLHPNSFWFFEREWVVNLILWGNMRRLTEAVLADTQLDAFDRDILLPLPGGQLLMFIGNRGTDGGPGMFMLPSGLAGDEDGRVYMVDQYFSKVDVFRPAALAADEGYLGVLNSR